MEQIINIELTVNEVNVILRSLGQHPFVEIADLIAKIKQQGEAQITKQEAANASTEQNQNQAAE